MSEERIYNVETARFSARATIETLTSDTTCIHVRRNLWCTRTELTDHAYVCGLNFVCILVLSVSYEVRRRPKTLEPLTNACSGFSMFNGMP